jgi:hypothetical protein
MFVAHFGFNEFPHELLAVNRHFSVRAVLSGLPFEIQELLDIARAPSGTSH